MNVDIKIILELYGKKEYRTAEINKLFGIILKIYNT